MNFDMFPLIFAGMTLVFLFVIFLFANFSLKTHPSEEGKEPILSLKCGIVIDILTLSTPFVRISCYEDFLIISYWKRLIVKYSDIKEISMKKLLAFYEVKIKISEKETNPLTIYIRCVRGNELYKLLKQKIKIN